MKSLKRGKRISEFLLMLVSGILLSALVLVSPLLATPGGGGAAALTEPNTSASVLNIGTLTVDDYGNKDRVFDAKKLEQLYKTITGTASYSSLATAFNNSSNYVTKFGSKVIQGSKIYTNAGNKDVLVNLGGINWVVASATVDNNGEYVATLFQKDTSSTNIKYNLWSSQNTATSGSPSNLYSASYIRNYGLGIEGSCGYFANISTADRSHDKSPTYQVFTKSKSQLSTSLREFVDTPEVIKYQETQNNYAGGGSHTCANDCWGTPSGTVLWYTDTHSAKNLLSNPYYTEWKTDPIWIPSTQEIGILGTTVHPSNSIWNIPLSTFKTSKSFWYRSTYPYDGNYVIISQANNANYINPFANSIKVTDANYSLRPAIHLNLTKAQKSSVYIYNNPLDAGETVYNGQNQSVLTLSTKPSWLFDEYSNSAFITVTNYLDDNVVTDMKDAGDYWVKVEFSSSYLNQLSSTYNQKAVFDGTADKSDNDHMESDTVRWYKFKIIPKEVAVNKPSYNTSTKALTAPTFATNSEIIAPDSVSLASKITGTAYDGTAVDQIDTVPVKKGNYTAQAILVNSDGVTPYSGGNYVIKNANTINCNISVGYQKLTVPTVNPTSATYTGSAQKFNLNLSQYNADWRDIATLTVPTGVLLKGDDTNGWYFEVTDAGTYSVTAAINADKSNGWCWDTGNGQDTVGNQTITFTVNRKTLFFDFTSTSGKFTMQQGETVTFGTDITSDIGTDTVQITLKYCNVDTPTTLIDVAATGLDASTIANSGTYKLVASIDDSKAVDNKNYVLSTDESLTTQEFTVSSAGITLTSVDWQYRENGGAPVAVSGSGESNANPYKVTYTGNQFVFSISNNAASLASAGVKIDSTYGTNGYANSSQTDATTAVVEITVRVIPYDETFAFYDTGHTLSANQYRDFTLYVKVDKASIDFDKLEWSAKELEYTGMSQSVSIKSGLPSFLTATCVGTSGTAIGDYTARISTLTVKNTDADRETANNYNIPSNTGTIPSHAWKIVKKKVNVSWINSEVSDDEGDNVVFVPFLSNETTGAVEYTYYPSIAGDPITPDLTNPLSIDDIVKSYDATKTTTYYVYARIKSGTGGSGVNVFDSSNCVLIEDDEEVAEAYTVFEIGDNKNPIRVSLKNDKTVYNKQPQPAEVEVEGAGFNKDNLVITYKEKNSDGDFVPMNDIPAVPLRAGEYKVCVSVSSSAGDFAITGQREFDYTIEKADIDFSDMKWIDALDKDKAEYTEAYTYFPGLSHKLEYVGTPKFKNEEKEGFTISFTEVTKSNAGKYTVTVTFNVDDPGVFDTLNFNVPESFDFEWEILPYTPDLSGVKWNYNDKPFVFTVKDGTAVKQSARLIGFPEDYAKDLESLIVYSGDTGEFSDIGTHTTSFTIDTDNEKYGNYSGFVLPAGLETTINWEIHPLTVEKAEQKQTKPFDVDGYTFKQITNLPDDFAEYFDVQVIDLDAGSTEIKDTDGTWSFKEVGRYRIKISFKTGMNKNFGGLYDNVKWADNSRSAYQITLTIEKLVFTVNGWIDGDDREKPTIDFGSVEDIDARVEQLEKYFDYDLRKFDTGTKVEMTDLLDYETFYTIALKLKEEFEGNVAVDYKGQTVEETAPYRFQTGTDPLSDPPENFYEIPEELTLGHRYKGEEITFEFGDWFESDVMQVIGEMKGTEIGDYPVLVGFKPGSLCAWGTEDDYVTSITVTFRIYEDDLYGRFVLTEAAAAKDAFKFQYEDFSFLEGDIKDYVYSTDNVVYMTKLTCEDTLDDLFKQFKNDDIKVYGEDGKQIETMTQPLCTGMILRLVDGETVLNQLTISVLGDVDGDGDITTVDKAQLNAYSLGTMDLTGAKLLAGDIDNDGDITTVDKAQLNAYTLGSFDIYENLVLKTATAQVMSVQVEENEEAVEENVITLAETVEIEIVKSEELKVNSEEVPERGEEPAKSVVLVDAKRLRISF